MYGAVWFVCATLRSVRCELQINSSGYRSDEQQCNEGWSVAASVYKLKGWYLRLNTPLFPVHFRMERALPDIAFKVAPHASERFEIPASVQSAPASPATHTGSLAFASPSSNTNAFCYVHTSKVIEITFLDKKFSHKLLQVQTLQFFNFYPKIQKDVYAFFLFVSTVIRFKNI